MQSDIKASDQGESFLQDLLEFLGEVLELLVDRDELGQLLDAEPALGLASQVAGVDRG